ncbi:HhoA/HhoB/HtrA family serine endopeptidase [Tychonema sp. BBK16]|uniref:HhoA/HhoB/HtrA family serine endopeptidase n=1 Tax=Tychonema sp. BBK16 TaxID=2699888 RepID=UPI001F231E80|nr:HhoA/HhoB/HtrA family serine endopeptidase [Tychonema sp. BBK16]MCF6375626.1 trypsin-like peptidase domain-containing protein [Tychonema sp. BBK16]
MGIFKFFRPAPRMVASLLSIFLGMTIALNAWTISPASASATIQNPQKLALRGSELPATASNNSFVTVAVDRVGPAVVRIDTERTVSRNLDPVMEDPLFRRFFGDDLRSQSPRQERLRGQGSGFVIDKSGTVLTNAHVVDKADRVTVTLNDGSIFPGEVLGTDEVTDLAVVKINTKGVNLPVAALGDSDVVKVGDWAIAVGNPLGFDNTVTLGIISTLKRSSAAVGIPDKRLDFIQTDAAINPGNSGGPLLNGSGEVIGINTAIRADAMGIGFAIPINKAKAIYAQLAKGEQVSHPFLGIQMIDLTPEIARENNADPNAPMMIPEVRGVLVMRVVPNTPAEKAGIRKGDAIVQIDGEAVTTAEKLQNLVENSQIGQSLKLKLRRGSLTKDVTVQTAQLRDF